MTAKFITLFMTCIFTTVTIEPSSNNKTSITNVKQFIETAKMLASTPESADQRMLSTLNEYYFQETLTPKLRASLSSQYNLSNDQLTAQAIAQREIQTPPSSKHAQYPTFK